MANAVANGTLGKPFQLQVGAEAISMPHSCRKLRIAPTSQMTTANSTKNVELLPSELMGEDAAISCFQNHVELTPDDADIPYSLQDVEKKNPCQNRVGETFVDVCREKQEYILQELIDNDLLGETEKVSVEMVLTPWFRILSRIDLAMVIKGLEAQKRYSLLLEVFNWMRKSQGKFQPNAHVCNMVLGILGRAGMVNEAEELFTSIRGMKEWDRVRSYNAMIAAYFFKGRRCACAWKLYGEMLMDGIEPNEITFNTLINGSNGQLRMLWEMRLRGLRPNLRSYNTVISVLSKAKGNMIEKIEQIVHEMISQQVIPDTYTFNSLIAVYGKFRMHEKSLDVLRGMKEFGIQPNVITYTSLIQMLSRCWLHNEAIQVFDEMEASRECEPDFTTYSLLVNVYSKAGLVAEAAVVFRKIQLQGYKPNVITWSSLISGYLQLGIIQRSKELWATMESHGIIADVHLFNMFINAYMKAGMVVEAGKVFEEMHARKISPDEVSFHILVNAFVVLGCMKQANAAYKQMKHAGFSDPKLKLLLLRHSKRSS